MIKIKLDSNFFDDRVKDIFEKLAKKIYENLKNENINIFCDGNKLALNEKVVFEFLCSEKFYDYSLKLSKDHNDNIYFILRDFYSFHQNTRFNTLLNPKKNSKVKAFNNKYSQNNEYDEFINKVKCFLKINNKLTLSKINKESFLEQKYKNYYKLINLNNIIDYSFLNSEDRHYILNKMNVMICPYCNMNYTINYIISCKNNNEKKIVSTGDIDHFYIKSKHPFYSLCLYNFIPSCQVCNSRLKGTTDMNVNDYIYPHKESVNENYKFYVENMIQLINSPNSVKPLVLIKQNNDCKSENSLKVFRVLERYQELGSLVIDLYEKYVEYNESYLEELIELLNENIDLKTLIFGEKVYEDEMKNVSLSKFKNDLLLQLGLL